MLRTDNGRILEHSSNINYAKVGKSCKTAAPARVCKEEISQQEQLDNLHRENACKVHYCAPMKKCMAKVGMHDSNGNFLSNNMIGLNVKRDGNVGGNQIGYVYQEKQIIDTDALFQALRDDNQMHNIATKLAQSNQELYGKDTTWDGRASGFFCVKCPPKKYPCPPVSICKKADPFNAPIGLGSDVNEARGDLRDSMNGELFQQVQLPAAKVAGAQIETQATEGTGGRQVPFSADRYLTQASGGRPAGAQGRPPKSAGMMIDRDSRM